MLWSCLRSTVQHYLLEDPKLQWTSISHNTGCLIPYPGTGSRSLLGGSLLRVLASNKPPNALSRSPHPQVAGVYSITVKSTAAVAAAAAAAGAPGGPSASPYRDGAIDVLVMENIFYDRQITRSGLGGGEGGDGGSGCKTHALHKA
jgi:hypothetical protein